MGGGGATYYIETFQNGSGEWADTYYILVYDYWYSDDFYSIRISASRIDEVELSGVGEIYFMRCLNHIMITTQ